MAANNCFIQNQETRKAYPNLFSELQVSGDITCNTLNYTTLNPAPTGTSKWITSGANIYNANAGNVGVGVVNPTVKLDVSGAIRCTTLNYTTLNPPIPVGTGYWMPDGMGGIYRDSKVAVGSGGVVQPEEFYVSGRGKFLLGMNTPLITGLGNINGSEFAYEQRNYNVSWSYFNSASPPVRPAYLTRNGNTYTLTTTGLVQRFTTSSAPNTKITSSYFIPSSDLVYGKPAMIFTIPICNGFQGTNPLFTAFGTLAITESAGFYRIEIAKNVAGDPFDSFSVAAQAWTGFPRIDITWSIFDGALIASGATITNPEIIY